MINCLFYKFECPKLTFIFLPRKKGGLDKFQEKGGAWGKMGGLAKKWEKGGGWGKRGTAQEKGGGRNFCLNAGKNCPPQAVKKKFACGGQFPYTFLF